MSARSERRREELIRTSNYYGEQAARAHLAGYHGDALTAAGLAIEALRKLVRRGGPDLPKYLDVLADALRDRAEIISALASPELYDQGVKDAKEGIELYREHGGAAGRAAPLWIATAQVQLAELYAATGQVSHANAAAAAALAEYRQRETADEQSQIHLAHALSRCANVMTPANAALATRREAVRRYRPWLTQDGHLWKYRFDRDLIWLSTPTLRRASQTAWDLAEQLGPPNKDTGREALAALQDAAEGFAALITSPAMLAPSALIWVEIATVREVAGRIAAWLAVVGATTTADAYLAKVDDNTSDVETSIRTLRPLLIPYADF
jgi:hypothetical protein